MPVRSEKQMHERRIRDQLSKQGFKLKVRRNGFEIYDSTQALVASGTTFDQFDVERFLTTQKEDGTRRST
jgi:hypothetical protein